MERGGSWSNYFLRYVKQKPKSLELKEILQFSAFIAILIVTSPVVINVPTRGLLALETKDSFVLWLAKFKYQKTCL